MANIVMSTYGGTEIEIIRRARIAGQSQRYRSLCRRRISNNETSFETGTHTVRGNAFDDVEIELLCAVR